MVQIHAREPIEEIYAGGMAVWAHAKHAVSRSRSPLGLRACDARGIGVGHHAARCPGIGYAHANPHGGSTGRLLMGSSNKKSWTVYIVRCANGTLYTGITNDLACRIADHNAGRGAKYTAAFGPVSLMWKRRKKDRSSASKLESAVKKLSRPEKEALISRPAARFSRL